MVLDGDSVLHIVDGGTKFSSAPFLAEVSTDMIWKKILTFWACTYTGIPKSILTGQGTQFEEKFINLPPLPDFEANRTGIEAHDSFGLVESYHEPLRSTFPEIKA